MKGIREHIEMLMEQLLMPADARCEFMLAYDKVMENEITGIRFAALVATYRENEQCDYKQLIADAVEIGEQLNIHAYTISLLLFLCLSKDLLNRYMQRGIPETVYNESMKDLAYKLEECRLVYGINGSFVASWFSGFFALTRFGLGRLQFEIINSPGAFTVDGWYISAGSKAINVHIPRTGTRLCREDVQEAYQMAAQMFSEEFDEDVIPFVCKSWLLDPWNLTVIKPNSNLALFCGDFKVVMSGVYEDYRELWRLFDCQYTGDVTKLPQDSSLRRAYAERVAKGEPIGWGFGIFFYRRKD